jgi:ATP-binding cassette subfamily F protein 3
VFDPVGRFSGGEKARLTLALLASRRPNLLLLDEPTNHLDIDMRHALTVALQSFEGGLVVVSHDRHLIKSVADSLWLVVDGAVRPFDGDLDDYQDWLRSRGRARQAAGAARAPKPQTGSQGGLLRRELARIEKRIASLTAEAARLEALDADAAAGLAEKRARLRRDIESLEAKWLQAGCALEEAEAETSESLDG